LGDPIGAGTARVFWAHGHDDPQLGRNDVQSFGAIFADPVHRPAAARAFNTVRLDHLFDARQPLGQVAAIALGGFLAFGLVVAWYRIFLLFLDLRLRNLKVFKCWMSLRTG
jgi:hypothetical protein